MKKAILPIFLSSVWISISEFVRNTFLLHNFWLEHYSKMGLTFPEENLNGALWALWSLCFAIVIYILKQKFNLIQTTFLAWFIGFIMMWIVIGNLGVLPSGILVIAIPLSMLETFLAAYIMHKFEVR